jgi:hypothetical protein
MAVVRHKEAIHSGHFMVSEFEAEAQVKISKYFLLKKLAKTLLSHFLVFFRTVSFPIIFSCFCRCSGEK